MNAKKIIEQAQRRAGNWPTGYRADIDENVLTNIMSMIWSECARFGCTTLEWSKILQQVIGVNKFKFFIVTIHDYKHAKHAECKVQIHHDNYYCL